MFLNQAFNTVAATINPDCYFKDKNPEKITQENISPLIKKKALTPIDKKDVVHNKKN